MSTSDINFTTTRVKIFCRGVGVGTASGFLFRHKGSKYLATNRHVVLDEEDNHYPDEIQIKLHKNRDVLSDNLEISIPLYREGVKVWLQHCSYHSNECDVVLIPLNENTLSGQEFEKFNQSVLTFIGSELINSTWLNG